MEEVDVEEVDVEEVDSMAVLVIATLLVTHRRLAHRDPAPTIGRQVVIPLLAIRSGARASILRILITLTGIAVTGTIIGFVLGTTARQLGFP